MSEQPLLTRAPEQSGDKPLIPVRPQDDLALLARVLDRLEALTCQN